jgi:hypothetical protein
MLPHLRKAMLPLFYKDSIEGVRSLAVRHQGHRFVIEAEKKGKMPQSGNDLHASLADVMLAGRGEAMIGNSHFALIAEPVRGGSLRGLFYTPTSVNFALAFRDDSLVCPLFLDHAVPASALQSKDLTTVVRDRDFVLESPLEPQFRRTEERLQLMLEGEAEQDGTPLKIEKVYHIRGGASEFVYSLQVTNAGFRRFEGFLATELDLGLPLESPLEGKNAKLVDLRSKELKMAIRLSGASPFSYVATPMLGLGVGAGPDTMQGARLVVYVPCDLKGQEKASLNLQVKLSSPGMLF